MSSTKKYEFKIMTIYVLLFGFTSCATFAEASHQSEEEKPGDLFKNKVNLSGDNFIMEWKVDKKAKCAEFKLNVVVDEKGWVLLGFMPASKNNSETKPVNIQDSKGDFVLTWLLSASERKTLDLNTIKVPGDLQIDDNSTRMDYQVTAENSTENSSTQVFLITRKLDTGDPQDVPITDQPMWIFGAYGNSEEYLTDLEKIKASNIGDSLKVQKVVLMDKTDSKTDDTKTWPDVVKEQVKKHWIGVVVGMAGLLTVMIVAIVYLCSRKHKVDKAKKIKMTFYKDDEDDEARVAFLHSRT